MKLWKSFGDGSVIPTEYCLSQAGARVALSDDRNPHLAWSDVPHRVGLERVEELSAICDRGSTMKLWSERVTMAGTTTATTARARRGTTA